jgi:hypothetical protein
LAIRLTFIAALLGVVLALAACSGQTDPATTAPAVPTTAAATATTVAAAATTGSTEATTAPSGSDTTAVEETTTVSASASDSSDLLTIADVEEVSRLTGVKTVEPRSMPGAGGDVNFVSAEGKLVLIATFNDGGDFDPLKHTENYREPISGLGDAAFVGPSKDVIATLYEVGFKKGDHTVLLVTFFKTGTITDTVISMDQLKELAGIVLSRL